MWRLIGLLAVLSAALAQGSPAMPGVERLTDGIRLQASDGYVSVHVRTDSIVRVTFSKTSEFRADDMVVVGPADAKSTQWTTTSTPRTVTLTTPKLRISVARADGAVSFADRSGRAIL